MVEITALASGSTGNCYHVIDGKTRLLLECGIPIKMIRQGLNFELSGVSGCLISHSHADHCKAAKDIIKAGIDCHMSQETASELNLSGHRVKIITPRSQFKIGTFSILPFELKHDVANMGFLIANRNGAKVLYITDSPYCKYRFRGLTHILLECNHSLDILRENVANGIISAELKNRIIKTHMSLQTAREFLKANDLSRVESIHLIHLSDDNSDADRFKKEVMELTGKPTYIA